MFSGRFKSRFKSKYDAARAAEFSSLWVFLKIHFFCLSHKLGKKLYWESEIRNEINRVHCRLLTQELSQVNTQWLQYFALIISTTEWFIINLYFTACVLLNIYSTSIETRIYLYFIISIPTIKVIIYWLQLLIELL